MLPWGPPRKRRGQSRAEVALLLERVAEQDARRALVEALRHPDPRVRAVAARVTFVGGLAVGPQLGEALRIETDPEAGEEQILALLPLADPATHAELLQHAARLGRSATAEGALARMQGAAALDQLPEAADDTERAAIPDLKPDPHMPRIRTISDLPSGLLPGIMAATECRPKGRTVAIAEIGYDRAARPVRVRIGASVGSPECERAMKPALALDTARGPGVGPTAEVVVVRLDEGIPSCNGSVVEVGTSPPARVGGQIPPPRKIKQVPPVYPAIAKGKRIQGTVVLDAVIDGKGCVSDVC